MGGCCLISKKDPDEMALFLRDTFFPACQIRKRYTDSWVPGEDWFIGRNLRSRDEEIVASNSINLENDYFPKGCHSISWNLPPSPLDPDALKYGLELTTN